ncbi:MAG: hypothetical protein AAFV32_09010, partial [Myxococcota bacterium]
MKKQHLRAFYQSSILLSSLYGCFDFSDIPDRSNPATGAACDPGFEAGSSTDDACVDIDECMLQGEAAPCSPLTECMNSVGSFTCTACPEGYEDDAQSGETCTPTLLDLNLSSFVSIDSEFAPTQRDYTVTFRSWLDRFEARFAVPEGSELLFEDEEIDDPNRVILEVDSVADSSVPFTVQAHGLGSTYNLAFEERPSESTLRASNLGEEDFFGGSVAIADGVIVVGANGEDGPDASATADAVENSGAAYVFERNVDGVWQESALLRASNLGEDDLFGTAVAIADGVIVVGTRFENGPDADATADAV